MAEQKEASLTGLGKFISFLLIVGLLGIGAYIAVKKGKKPDATAPSPTATVDPQDQQRAGPSDASADAPVASMAVQVPRLAAPTPYEVKDNTVDIELSEYAGYAGLIVANSGLAPSENSVFFKKHGFKVKLSISEEESWSALNSGKMAASATTADVLAVYGKQFNVTVPAQIGFSRGADGIVVRKEITRINGLKGKTLATSQFTEAEFFIRYLAQEAGLGVNMLPDASAKPDPEKVNLVFYEDAFAAGDAFLAELNAGETNLAGCVTWAPKTTEVAEGSNGKARVLTTNRNLLIVADVLIVNRGFAEANPKIVEGLVDGLLEGNRMVRDNPDANLETIAKAFNSVKDPVKDKNDMWDRATTKEELAKVHLSNLPESLAFFNGSIDSAGSFGGIYQSAVLAYGDVIKDPVDSDRFMNLSCLQAIDKEGTFKDQKISIAPVHTGTGSTLEVDPLLSKDIRFFFQPNSSKLELQNPENTANLAAIKDMLQVSPGSKVLLRGHVDDARKAEFLKAGGEAMVQQQALKAMQLSKERANEIRRLLVDTSKADPERIDTIGRGWEEPAGKDSDKNRRVEVYWYTLE